MNHNGKLEEYRVVIRPLYLLMQLSVKAYRKYLLNKIYLHACAIRSSNQKIYDHLVSHLSSIPGELEPEVLDLLNHYDIWMAQFSEFEKENSPKLKDSFIFHHLDEHSAFPRKAEEAIFSYYTELKNSIKQTTDE